MILMNKKFYKEVIKTRFKLSVNKFFIATIFLYLLIILVTILSYKEPYSDKVKIGFVYEDNIFTKNLMEQFKYYSEDFFIPIRYSSIDELEKDVKKNDIDCGYILPKEYSGKNNSIKYISSNKTITGTYSNLLISSIYLQNGAGTIGYSVSKNNIDKEIDLLKEKIDEKNKKYLEDAPFMSYNYRGIEGEKVISNNGIYIILYSILGLFITLLALIFSLGEIFDNNVAIYLNLKNSKNRLMYYIGNNTVYFLILLIFSFINIILIEYFFTQSSITLNQIFDLSLFNLMIVSGIFTFSLIKNSNISSLFIIFYFITSCIFGSVFIDIDLLFSFISPIKFIYPTYYFKAIILENNENIRILILFITLVLNGVNYYIIKNLKFKIK